MDRKQYKTFGTFRVFPFAAFIQVEAGFNNGLHSVALC